MRTSGKTNNTPGLPNLHRAGSGGGEKTYKKRSQSWSGGLSSRLLGQHTVIPQGCIFLYFLNKTELSHEAVTLVCPRAVVLIYPSLQIFVATRQN